MLGLGRRAEEGQVLAVAFLLEAVDRPRPGVESGPAGRDYAELGRIRARLLAEGGLADERAVALSTHGRFPAWGTVETTAAGGYRWRDRALATLRGLGFKPSKSNLDALQAGWDYLPNQSRLVDALKETVAHQRKMQALAQNQKSPAQAGSGLGMGPTQPPGVPPNPGDPNGGVSVGVPGNTINQPIG